MNKHPLEQAADRDLRLSHVAIQRAAQRAHDVAKATGTAIVVSHNGVIQVIHPTHDADKPATACPPTS